MRDTCAIALPEPAQPRTTLKVFTGGSDQPQSSRLPVLTSANDQTRSERDLSTVRRYHKMDSTDDLTSVAPICRKQPDLRVLVVNNGNRALADLIRKMLEAAEVGSLWIERDRNGSTNDLYQYTSDPDALLLIL